MSASSAPRATASMHPMDPPPSSALVHHSTGHAVPVPQHHQNQHQNQNQQQHARTEAPRTPHPISEPAPVRAPPPEPCSLLPVLSPRTPASFGGLPNEVLLQILGFLDVNDLLSTSRTSHHLRCLCVAPILHLWRRRRSRDALAFFLSSPSRPSLSDLISRSIFLTKTTVVSRKLARSLVSIRLSHRLAARPPVKVLVDRCVLPSECAPGIGHVAPSLVARTRAIERQKLKDDLKHWVGAVWKREVGRRSEYMRKWEEAVGIGRVWRLRKFWERVGRGERERARAP